jgi:AraC-like DNA-binding protein
MRTTIFRPSPAPRIALPFGVRSCGHYEFPTPRTVDRTGERPFVQLYWGVHGTTGFGFPDGEIELHPGDVVVYPLNSRHQVTVREAGSSYRWATFDGPLADQAVRAFGLVPPWPRRAGPVPSALFEELARLLSEPGLVSERQAAAVGWALLSAAAAPPAGDDQLVNQAQEALLAGMADPHLGIEVIADRLGIDRSVLSRRFAASVGLSPKQYLQSLRLNRAMTLLAASDRQVGEVANACGFASGNYFARVFKAATGETPEEFRHHVR